MLSQAAGLCQAVQVMPWRTNTLTEFRSTQSTTDDLSDEGLGQFAERPSWGIFGDDSMDEGLKDWEHVGSVDGESCIDFDLSGWQEPSIRQGGVDASALGATQVPRGQVLSNDNFSQMLFSAFASHSKPLHVKMPWEKGVASKIFGKKQTGLNLVQKQASKWVPADLPFAKVDLSESVVAVEEPSAALSGSLFEKALSAVSDVGFQMQRRELLDTAVDKWFSIIRVNLLGSSVGRDIIGQGSWSEQKAGAYRTIEAIIGVRSRSTAISRANSLLKFFRWRATTTNDDGKPVTEKDAWGYLSHLRDEGAAPTRASGFMAACGYAVHVFVFSDFAEVYNSRRLRGLSDILYSLKKPLKQARVLTVSEVLQLHAMVNDEGVNHVDRALAAYAIVALYTRSRHSDLMHVEKIVLDFDSAGGYIELSTQCHKTARSASQKAQFLPIVAPVLGVDGVEWVSSVIHVFQLNGLSFEGDIQGPIMRPPRADGQGPCVRGVTSSEITKFLRLLFEANTIGSDELRVSSHSLKATTLSWCAKFGLGPYDKSVLGRHASVYSEAQAVYSRDLAIGSVMKLQKVILEISKQAFAPDNSRRGYFLESQPGGDAAAVETVKIEDKESEAEETVEVPEEQIVDLDSESSDSSTSKGESDRGDECAPPARKVFRHTLGSGSKGRFVMHKVSKMVHYRDSLVCPERMNRSGTLSCGRAMSANYVETMQFDTVAVCRRCKINAMKDSALPSV